MFCYDGCRYRVCCSKGSVRRMETWNCSKIPRELQTRDDKFEVMAVDYGTIFFVSRRNILRYPDEVKMRFTETPPLAIPCRLHGLSRWWTGKTTIEEQRREISHVLRFGEQ